MSPLRRELKIEMRGRDVRLLQEALRSAGFAPEDAAGEFGRSTAFALRAFQSEHNLPVSGVLDRRTFARLSEVLERDPFGPRPDEPGAGRGLAVRGRVTQADGTPIPGARVQALEKALLGRADRLLGQAQSDEGGLYEIRVPRVDADGIDLLMQVLAPDGEEVITRSPLILGAEGERTVDLIVSSPLYPPPSEFAQIGQQLDPLLVDVDLNALDRDSLALLAGKTGLSPLRVTHYVQARRFAAQGRVSAEVYYGLFRANLPVNKPALVAQDNALLAEALTTASRAGAIDSTLAEKPEAVAKLVARLNAEAIDDLIKQPALSNGTPSLGAFVNLAGLSDSQQRAFTQIVQTHDAPGREFWKRLEADPAFDEQAVRSVRLAAQLGMLTFNNAPLMAELHQRLRDAGNAGDPLRGLVGLDQGEWLSLIDGAVGSDGTPVIPAGIPVSGAEKPVEAYARTMARVVEDTYPTATIAARLGEDDFEGATQVRAFLDHAPDYEIRETSVRRYVQSHDVDIDPAQQAAVERVQRVFALAPRFERYETMRPLLAKGVDSAYAIKTMGERRFMQTFGETLGETQAHAVFDSAAQKTALTTTLFAKYGAQFNNVPMAVLPDMNIPGVLGEVGEILGPELAMDFATWEGLFGSADFCACEHCRSVFSPAAYLVTLLKFLRDRGALDELAARRADIGNVELNCHNTHTTLPYVDLVNEVLEGFIAGAADVHQTEGEAGDLRVHPEHVNVGAYTALESRVYPWVLPFGLWTEEARAYLQPLDVARHAIMDHFNPALPEDRNVAAWLPIATERLGLLEAERDILLDGAFHASHWNNVPLNSLQTVRTLLDTARISFLELRQMLDTRFINGDGALVIDYVVGEDEDAELTCDLTEARIEALTTGHLNRIERFTRLRRKLGWSAYELDVALTALGGTLNDQTLVNLSFVHALRERLEVDLPVIASWVANLDTRPYLGDDDDGQHPSYYASLFLNRTVGGPDDLAPFQPGALGGAAIDDHEAAILAALQIITAEELALIRERRLADGALSMANLSEMHRVATFKRALEISVRDLLDLLDLTGLNPFSAASLYDALRVIDVLDTIGAAGFTLPELGYLLRHEFDANSRVAPSEAQIAVFLTQLRAGLQRIRASFQAAPDPRGEITTRLLGAVIAPDDLLPSLALLYGVAPASELPADPAGFLNARFAPFIPDPPTRADVIARLVDDTDPGYLQPEVEQAGRFALVLEPLAAYLRAINSVALVQQMSADFLEIELGASDLLLGGLIRSV
ncbi:MAG: peptidoglycan-binding protein, partial [Anaerolineae bacterium]|nr:peptidoglycan-binding protein [Anaerolineae bacterium]